MYNLQGKWTARFSVIQVYFISIVFHLILYYYDSINKSNVKAKLKTGIVLLGLEYDISIEDCKKIEGNIQKQPPGVFFKKRCS